MKCNLFSSLARLQAINVHVNHRAYVKQGLARHANVEVYRDECSEHMTHAMEGNSLNIALNKVVKHTSQTYLPTSLKPLLENTVLNTFLGHKLKTPPIKNTNKNITAKTIKNNAKTDTELSKSTYCISPTSHAFTGSSKPRSKTLNLPRFRKQMQHILSHQNVVRLRACREM